MRRHLSEQQLVDLVIGTGSRFGKLSARHHLAACALCRSDLDTLRRIDQQLEHEGGGDRLAAVPRLLQPTAAETPRIDSAPAVIASEPPAEVPSRWQRAVVPLMAAACALLALNVSIEIPEVNSGPEGQVVYQTESAGQRSPDLTAVLTEPAEPAPNVVELQPPVTRVQRTTEEHKIRPSSPPSPPQLASARPMQHPLDTASRVMCQRHPGAGRGDDRVSSPTNGV